MTVLTANSALQAFLSQAKEVTEIRDLDGGFIGYFKPRVQVEDESYQQAAELFDPVEMERRAQREHGSGKPLEEVLRHLRSVEPSE